MTKRIQPHILVLLAVTLAWSATADTLYLRDGEQAPGHLTRMSEDTVWFENRDGEHEFKKSEVHKVQLQRARQFDGVEKVDQITDPDLKQCLDKLPEVADFPAAGAVTLLDRAIFDLTEEGAVKVTRRFISRVLRQRGEQVATSSVWYFEDTDTPRIDYALTITPDGRVLHLDDAALKNEAIFARFPDYRRLSRYRFACKEPRPGSVLDVQYTVKKGLAGLLDSFYTQEVFRAKEPILRQEVIVLIPAAKEKTLVAELAGPEVVTPSRSVADGLVRLTWTLTDPQKGLPTEPLMPPVTAFAPTLTLGTAATWNAVSATYAKALKTLGPLPDELAAKAKELAAQDGARAIHSFVARGIRTVPVPHPSYSFMPQAPADTAKRGLANELDKNVLYWKLLEAAGIDSSLVLTRDRARGPLAENVPSLRAFNRSAVYLADEDLYSNAASDTLAFDTLPGQLQGTPVLRAGVQNPLATTQQPALEAEADQTTFKAVLATDGALHIEVTYTATGNGCTWMRNLKDLDEQKLRNQLQQFAGYLHPAAALTDYSTSELADLNQSPWLSLTCEIPGYAVKAGDDLMLFDLPALYYSAQSVGRPSRIFDLFWPHVSRDSTTGTIAIPDGFTVYSMPENVTFDSPVASYHASLQAKNGTVTFSDVHDLKVNQAPRDAYADYKACLELRARIPRQRVILTREK
jgi:uncharacterized protein DUF3857